MYHYTRDLSHSRYPNIKGLDLPLFREQIQFFKKNFSIVTMEEAIEAFKGNAPLPERALLLTFDDGYIDNYTCAFPILDEEKIQGSFFIPGKSFTTHQLLDVNKIHFILERASNVTELLENVCKLMNHYRGNEFCFPSNEELYQHYAKPNRFDGKEIRFIKQMLQTVLPDRVRVPILNDLFHKYVDISEEKLACELYMTYEQVRTLHRHGMYIGVHGYDHYWLGNLPKEQMQQDISKALDIMDEFIDRKQWVMSYPYDSLNTDVTDYIKSRGACLGFTAQKGIANLSSHPLKLPRLDCNDFPPVSENYQRKDA